MILPRNRIWRNDVTEISECALDTVACNIVTHLLRHDDDNQEWLEMQRDHIYMMDNPHVHASSMVMVQSQQEGSVLSEI